MTELCGRAAVREWLGEMAVTLGRRPDNEALSRQLDSYAAELAGQPSEAVRGAIGDWPRHERRMPKLLELLRLVHGQVHGFDPAGKPAAKAGYTPARPLDFWGRVHALEEAALAALELSVLGRQAQAEGWWWPLRRWASELVGFQAQTVARCEMLGEPVRVGRSERVYVEIYQLDQLGWAGKIAFDVPGEVIRLCREATLGGNVWLLWQGLVVARHRPASKVAPGQELLAYD